MYKIKEKAGNFTTSVKDSIKNAKTNSKTMVRQVKCIKNKIVRKFLEKKLPKVPSYFNYDSYSYIETNQKRRNSEYVNYNKSKQRYHFSQLTKALNISGIKKKVLKLVHLDECFEVKEEKYGFRTKVTLVENSPCIFGSTCRGEPEPELETMTSQSRDIQNEADDDDLIENYPDNLDRQTGKDFSSDGPAECRVVRTSQCTTNG